MSKNNNEYGHNVPSLKHPNRHDIAARGAAEHRLLRPFNHAPHIRPPRGLDRSTKLDAE